MMAKMGDAWINSITIFIALFILGTLHAQDVEQYWSRMQPEEMSTELTGDEILLCTAIKMFVLPEAKKNTAYKLDARTNANATRYMNEYCPAQHFTNYLRLLNDLQDDILTTQKILKKIFEKQWTMKSLQRDFMNYFQTEGEYRLKCYANDIQLSIKQKYILHLVIIELQSKDFFGIKINDSTQRQVILKLFERVYGVKKIIDGNLQIDPELEAMIMSLKAKALLEAKNHSLINHDSYEALKTVMLN